MVLKLLNILNGKLHQPFSTGIFSKLFFSPPKSYLLSNEGLLICTDFVDERLMFSDVKLGYSLIAIIHAEAHRYSYISTQRAYFPCIMHGISSSWPPDSRSPASPVSAAEHRTTSSLPLGEARCQTLGSRRVEGASRHPYSDLLLKAGPVRVGCSNQELCPVEF